MFSFSQISLIGDHLSKMVTMIIIPIVVIVIIVIIIMTNFPSFVVPYFKFFFKFRISLGHPFSFDVYHYLIAFLRYHYSYHFVISFNIRKSLRGKRKRKGKPHVQDLS